MMHPEVKLLHKPGKCGCKRRPYFVFRGAEGVNVVRTVFLEHNPAIPVCVHQSVRVLKRAHGVPGHKHKDSCALLYFHSVLYDPLKTNQTNRFNLIVAAAHAFGQCIEGSKGHGKSDGGDGTLRRHAKEAR